MVLVPHQVEAVARVERLLLRHGGALLADEIGLGKSWVAAEVMRRWQNRSGGTVELVVPASLTGQWRETLREFGVTAGVHTHDAVPAAVLGGGGGRPLIVVDEAHAYRNASTRRYDALARRTAVAATLLVTATPVCNSSRDLHALLRLIVSDDALLEAGVPSIDFAFESLDREAIPAIVSELIIRRGRDVLAPALAFGRLDRHVIRHRVAPVDLERLRFPSSACPRVLRHLLLRRLESSPAALVESLSRQKRYYERALSALAAGRMLPRREFRRAFAHELDDGLVQEVLFWEVFAPPATASDATEMRREVDVIEAIVREVSAQSCGKRALLAEIVAQEREPLLVFTGAAATAHDLFEALMPVRRCGLVTSRSRARDAVLASFRDGRIDLIVSTDMASEGLNLQRAGVVVHYDLPWNPVKIDQRNGRAHRIGQRRSAVRAFYFIPDSRVSGVVETVARKNRMRRRLLDSPGPAGGAVSTLRPRLVRSAAYARLVVEGHIDVPETFARRNKAGVERLLEELFDGSDRERRLGELVTMLLSAEEPRPGGQGQPLTFA